LGGFLVILLNSKKYYIDSGGENMSNFLVAILINPFLTSIAFDVGRANDAKSMIQKAAAFIKANGKEKAVAEFNNPQGKFIDRDLYILAVDFKGIILANGANAKRVGQNMHELKDANGKLLFQEFIETAKTKGSGWVDYKWFNSETKKVEDKSTYIQKMDDYFIGCELRK
jgi:signal transduction histidine kinase